jgi:hypothetical protein
VFLKEKDSYIGDYKNIGDYKMRKQKQKRISK